MQVSASTYPHFGVAEESIEEFAERLSHSLIFSFLSHLQFYNYAKQEKIKRSEQFCTELETEKLGAAFELKNMIEWNLHREEMSEGEREREIPSGRKERAALFLFFCFCFILELGIVNYYKFNHYHYFT